MVKLVLVSISGMARFCGAVLVIAFIAAILVVGSLHSRSETVSDGPAAPISCGPTTDSSVV